MNTFENLVLVVEAKGEIVSSNLELFREKVQENLALVNRNLQTDEDFGQAELDVKGLKFAEEVVKEAKRKALEDAESLNAFFAALDESAEEVRQARLELEKLIKERKEKIKKELVAEALGAIDCDPSLKPKFNGVIDSEIKGKKSVDSIKKGLSRAVALCNGGIRESREVIALFRAQHGDNSVPDERNLEIMNASVVKVELQRRADLKKADEEKARLVEEAAQARREAQAAREETPEAPAPPQQSTPIRMSVPVAQVAKKTADTEWAEFKVSIFAAFGQIKEAKQKLEFEENIQRIDEFSKAINAAWKTASRGGQES